MFAVIFEVNPRPERWDAYLGYAKMLRPALEQIDGFVNNERFSSLRRKGWLLSLSIWRDEKAVIRWRTHARHHEVQQKGRTEVFGDYHLRVGEMVADNRLSAGEILREQRFDETAAAAKLIVLADALLQGLPRKPDAGSVAKRLGMPDAADLGLLDWDVFESIVQPGKFILLTSWRDMAAATGLLESGGIHYRRVRVIRDYGMFDRAEAPQYYPPVPTGDGPG
jgi:heme-degrading monooxygenase HmoA